MNTESQQQFEREEAEKFCSDVEVQSTLDGLKYATSREVMFVKFLSAIERATQAKDKEIADHVVGMLERQAAQPQRSEPQKWTPERVGRYFIPPIPEHIEELAKDFNAVLTAERQRREQAEQQLTEWLAKVKLQTGHGEEGK